ncbi:hypothetical protein TpMuguga_02g00527 [Theileria parva strain Muguga]|uniref:Uncharacterized protein n=1 Tax=Theileria parva TaxID=5875 RepID=Q4N4W3_THEPA|nr:uncharacterized protein TpMuguga_02g00527 [Theileria parva strain Muguga]EAN32810.1 hypothetical protein TpMuguga_02g00527 [Theileria parva strain Muguga]|eukprot:XP_765093.1 hypothetical protein [Theileria parva strain Muguga]
MEIIHVDETDLQKFRNSKNPKIRSCNKRLVNEATRRKLEKLKDDSNVTSKIPASVLDRLISALGGGTSERSVISEANESSRDSGNVKLINVDFSQREPSDKINVMSDYHYNSIEAKTGFGIMHVFDNLECIWNECDPKNYATHVLKYKNAEEFFITILRRNSSLIHLKSSNLEPRFRLVEEECFSFNHLKVIKVNGKMAKYNELIKEFEGRYLKIWFPFLADKVIYKGEIIFKDDEKLLVSLSIDLLTGNIEAHSYKPSGNPDPIELVFKCDKSTVENLKVDDSTVENLESEGHYQELSIVDGLCNLQSCLSHYYNKSNCNQTEQDYYKRTEKEFFDLIATFMAKLEELLVPGQPCQALIKLMNRKLMEELISNNTGVEFMELDIGRRKYDDCIIDLYPNSRYYRAPKDTSFNKILDNGNVIWERQLNEESIKAVYLYSYEEEKWLVNVFNDNTVKFLHKPARSENFFDVSKLMLNTRDLKIIKRNSKLSTMDLTFDFTGSFCIIPLVDVLSVSYKGEVHEFKECGEHLSVFLLYDMLENELYVFNSSI